MNVIFSSTAVDCILSDWSEWSECSVTCGDVGIKSRTRQVVQLPQNTGAECGPKVERTFCDGLPPCDQNRMMY